jgi:hypothetical protein
MLFFSRYVAWAWIYLMSEINEFVNSNEIKAIGIFNNGNYTLPWKHMAEQASY